MNAVALHAIDVITVSMDFDRGADREDVLSQPAAEWTPALACPNPAPDIAPSSAHDRTSRQRQEGVELTPADPADRPPA